MNNGDMIKFVGYVEVRGEMRAKFVVMSAHFGTLAEQGDILLAPTNVVVNDTKESWSVH
jgi:hypothetical protein